MLQKYLSLQFHLKFQNLSDLMFTERRKSTVPYFLDKYNIENITVTGLFLGSCSTITKFFVNWRRKYKIEKEVKEKIINTSLLLSTVLGDNLEKPFICNKLNFIKYWYNNAKIAGQIIIKSKFKNNYCIIHFLSITFYCAVIYVHVASPLRARLYIKI